MSKKTAKPTGSSGASAATSRREQLRLQQEAEARRARTMKMIGLAAALLALAIIAGVGITLWKDQKNKQETVSAQGRPANANADSTGIIANPGKAKDGAPVLQVYQDYQCPACKDIHSKIGPLVNDLAAKGEITLDYRTMTFLDTNLRNDSSIRAGIAAACADNAGAYEKYHDIVYANQPTQEGVGYTDEQLSTTFAEQAGITGSKLTDFQTCYKNEATKGFVQGTDEAAAKAKVTSTPTYRVNGKDLDLQTIGTTEQSLLEAIKKVAAS
ncbi:DsbA family protein [Luteococcus peritonei]|uniref:DsbA family protein n=1 Tax=Luteococcus peritonei TaxID=88874 RepID=A0ABW4RTX0_9ACTN